MGKGTIFVEMKGTRLIPSRESAFPQNFDPAQKIRGLSHEKKVGDVRWISLCATLSFCKACYTDCTKQKQSLWPLPFLLICIGSLHQSSSASPRLQCLSSSCSKLSVEFILPGRALQATFCTWPTFSDCQCERLCIFPIVHTIFHANAALDSKEMLF